MGKREMEFIKDLLALAIHAAQVCPHGVGTDPDPMPDGYLDRDREWADLIYVEYERMYKALEDRDLEQALNELVAEGLIETVPA